MNIDKIIGIVRETDGIFFDENLRKDVKEKGKSDYVTRADIEISNFLHGRLKEEFPDIDFLSEEETADEIKNNDYWILDPIDGTTNFMHQISMSAVSLGLCSGGEVVLGVIYVPYTNELFYAEKGMGAYLNGTPISCSENSGLSDCLGLMEFNAYFKDDYKNAMKQASAIYLNCQDLRTFGSAAVELAYIACGRADVFLGRYLKPWDYAAAMVIVTEAGGRVGRTDGEINLTEMNRHIVAANSAVYDEFVALINNEVLYDV